jgi:hypothetical protein
MGFPRRTAGRGQGRARRRLAQMRRLAYFVHMKRILVLFFMSISALAADWTSYSNARFGETIDIPPDFVSNAPGPENGDGLTFHSADGKVELLVWGNSLSSGGLKSDTQERLQGEKDAGWNISYRKNMASAWFIFSGSKNDRIMYMRSIASCKGTQALHFRIEYPKEQKQEYDAIITRLGKTLKAGPASDCS